MDFKECCAIAVIWGCIVSVAVWGADAQQAAKPKTQTQTLVPPPPVTINLNMRMTQVEAKLNTICSMVKYLYQRQICEDAEAGKKKIPPVNIKTLGPLPEN